jgi:hypothetical protein
VTEQQVSQEETIEMDSIVEWKFSAIRGYEDSMGDQVDLPIGKEVQHRRLHKKSQPLEKMDREIEKITRLMFKSAEAVNKEELSRGETSATAGKKEKKQQHHQQQQHSWRGARGQLQGKVWDPRGFQH